MMVVSLIVLNLLYQINGTQTELAANAHSVLQDTLHSFHFPIPGRRKMNL